MATTSLPSIYVNLLNSRRVFVFHTATVYVHYTETLKGVANLTTYTWQRESIMGNMVKGVEATRPKSHTHTHAFINECTADRNGIYYFSFIFPMEVSVHVTIRWERKRNFQSRFSCTLHTPFYWLAKLIEVRIRRTLFSKPTFKTFSHLSLILCYKTYWIVNLGGGWTFFWTNNRQ